MYYFQYGGIRRVDCLIGNIKNRRNLCPFETSSDLIDAIHAAGLKTVSEIAKVFQSLRNEVNDEVQLRSLRTVPYFSRKMKYRTLLILHCN